MKVIAIFTTLSDEYDPRINTTPVVFRNSSKEFSNPHIVYMVVGDLVSSVLTALTASHSIGVSILVRTRHSISIGVRTALVSVIESFPNAILIILDIVCACTCLEILEKSAYSRFSSTFAWRAKQSGPILATISTTRRHISQNKFNGQVTPLMPGTVRRAVTEISSGS